MKQIIKKVAAVLFTAALMAPLGLVAQDKDKEKEEKDKKDKKEAQQIIITRTGNNDEKEVIEVIGDKVTVNGKPIDELKDGDISVHTKRIKDAWAYGGGDEYGLGQSLNQNFAYQTTTENRAMLGVTTEKADKGVEIQSISKESAAEKAGLKLGDVISKIDDQKIEDPDDLSKAIRAHKPGEKVSVTYLRDGKEQKASAELGKWKGVSSIYVPGVQGYGYKMPDMNFDMPRIQTMPRAKVQGYNSFSWSGGGPRLGVSVQDTEDGKGVKVIDVDEDGNGSKAGIKDGDIITEVDGMAVNSADEVAKIMRDSKDKVSVKMKLLRSGKSETVDVKIPRKLKTTDL